MAGIRVAPPTRITSSMSLSVSFASDRACLTGPTHRSTRSAVSWSNFARVSRTSRCLGPVASAVMNGRPQRKRRFIVRNDGNFAFLSLPFITADATGPRHLDVRLTRAKFDQLTADLVERCVGPVKQALSDAKLTDKDIDEVILVGGATRMPADQAWVRRLMGGKEPNQAG